MGRLNLKALDGLFDKGKDFQLTNTQYEERVGAKLPKDGYYLRKKSLLAARAKEKGYVITEVKEKAVIERVVCFRKEKN